MCVIYVMCYNIQKPEALCSRTCAYSLITVTCNTFEAVDFVVAAGGMEKRFAARRDEEQVSRVYICKQEVLSIASHTLII